MGAWFIKGKVCLSLLCLCLLSLSGQCEMVVVVSKDSPLQALENQQIANIFLTRTNRYPDGNKATPIELRDSLIRDSFYQKVSGKTPTQLMAYWTTLIFSGKGKPPRGFQNVKSLITRLENSPGSISYLSLSQVTEDLKIVYRFP